jgi:hypothetical protein
MRYHSGQFVVTARERYNLARHVDPSARQAEGVHLRQIDQKETKLQLIGREMLGQSATELLQASGQRWIINRGKIASKILRHCIAKVDFLLVAEDVLAEDPIDGRRLRTGLLRPDACSEKARKRKLRAQTWKNPHIQDKLTRAASAALPKHDTQHWEPACRGGSKNPPMGITAGKRKQLQNS